MSWHWRVSKQMWICCLCGGVYNYFCQNCPFNGKSLFFLLIETLEIEKSSCFVGASFFHLIINRNTEKLSCVWKVHGSGFRLWKNTAPHENLMFLSFLSFWWVFVYKSQYTCCSLQSLKHTPLDFPNWRHVLLIFSLDMFGGDLGPSWHFSVCQFHALIMMGRY